MANSPKFCEATVCPLGFVVSWVVDVENFFVDVARSK